jgi:hypothetical protein
MAQKVFILANHKTEEIEALNKLLNDGWEVKESTPMNTAGESSPYIFVVAEKRTAPTY